MTDNERRVLALTAELSMAADGYETLENVSEKRRALREAYAAMQAERNPRASAQTVKLSGIAATTTTMNDSV